MSTRSRPDVPLTQSAEAPLSLVDLIPRAVERTPDQLVAELAPLFLVGPSVDRSQASGGDEEWAFRTASLRTVRETFGGTEVIMTEHHVVFPIRKTKAGPFATTIFVGRSASNDLCIVHGSVSKLHARVAVKEGRFLLSDAGSSNGTTVNGKRLAPNEEIPLTSGDHLLIGGCAYFVLDAARLHNLLVRFAKRR